MPKQPVVAADLHTLFLWGRQYDFALVRLQPNMEDTLQPAQYNAPNLAAAQRRQKTQIVLHATASNSSAQAVVNGWAGGAVAAHYIVERTSAGPSARPALRPGATHNDAGLVDVIQCAPDGFVVNHAADMANRNAIGIEHANLAHGIRTCNTANEPSRNAATGLPDDLNRWIHISDPVRSAQGGAGRFTLRGGQTRDLQAYEDQQYQSMIMLLRHLCIENRIPRRFLGVGHEEALRRWREVLPAALGRTETADELRGNTREYMNFRGILGHHNLHKDKTCPGIYHRNRLFRGLIDEWWMPVDLGQGIRGYYSGPFRQPTFVPGNPTAPSLFRWTSVAAGFVGHTYHDARLPELFDTTSFFDLNQVDSFFLASEQAGRGVFPVGQNRTWHGGVHLQPQPDNPCVYAAASGVIVAARLTSNPVTDAEPGFGSQRFVLVQHAIHFELEDDPAGAGGTTGHRTDDPKRIRYDSAVFVYTLYMHLGPMANLAGENPQNPPWLNRFFQDNPGVNLDFEGDASQGRCAGDAKGQVFSPGVEVSVGDILGFVGTFAGDRTLQFEVFSGFDSELGSDPGRFGATPWDTANKRGVDDDVTQVTNNQTLTQFLRAAANTTPALAAGRASDLRDCKVRHLSEWALTDVAQLQNAIPNQQQRNRMFVHMERFSWVAEAIAALPALANARFFGGNQGLFWFYHPITFMEHANTLIRRESVEVREMDEPARTDINVLHDEDGFLTRFVDFDAASSDFVQVGADNDRIKTWERTGTAGATAYRFQRDEIACAVTATPHNPAVSPPETTKFALALLNFVEEVRGHFNQGITVRQAHLCRAHAAAANCVVGEAAQHAGGVAVDIAPAAPNAARCVALWNAVKSRAEEFNDDADAVCGSPAWGEIPIGFNAIAFTTQAADEALLNATPQQPPSNPANFVIHINLVAV